MQIRLAIPAVMLFAGCLAFGQQQNAGPRVAGNIESFDGHTLVIKTLDGKSVSVMLPADQRIVAREKGSLASIKEGDFAGSAANEGPDGKLYAEEVHIMVGGLVGVGEGHRPMAPNPEAAAPGAAPPSRTMTNATVAGVTASNRTMTNGTVGTVTGSEGRVLKMQYKGGENEIQVAPNTQITRMTVADRSILKPGAAITVATTKSENGLVAGNLFIDIDQNKPR